jgi:Rieske Fe-S protein
VPAPRLATLRPDLPPQFDAVIQQAVNPDPQQRISSVSELLALFEKACSVASTQTAISKQKTIHDRETTLPSTVNWDKEENLFATGKWKGASPVEVRPEEKGSSQKRPRVESPAAKSAYDAVQEQDPFVWWSNMSAKQAAVQPTPSTPTKTAPRMTAAKKRSEHKPGRRRAVAMIAGGSVVALGALGFGGVTLAHRLQNKPVATTGTPKQSSMTMTQPTKTTTKAQPTKAANSNPPKGTTQPAPPKHTGTVVGSTTLGVNTAKTFTNPKDGTGSLLIHLPNGNFVAYNSACTHVGVTVHYDPATQKLVCPAHGSIFDPANMATPLKGPAMTPLQTVPIHVNGDGTITVG